ncbi:hypothetical protein ACO1PK_12555 [Alishewanella sp. d11]|uniref:hypothetical protein n=1 Tax=Alishewanella sp. d11 TaxID=3414030 RepID=UPI003BF8E0DD
MVSPIYTQKQWQTAASPQAAKLAVPMPPALKLSYLPQTPISLLTTTNSAAPKQAGESNSSPAAESAETAAAFKINLSQAARNKLAAEPEVAAPQQQWAEQKKAQARERIVELKKRIDELNKLLRMFGALGAKTILRAVQQLAAELKSASKDLKEGWDLSTSSPTTPVPAVSVKSSVTAEQAVSGILTEPAAQEGDLPKQQAVEQAAGPTLSVMANQAESQQAIFSTKMFAEKVLAKYLPQRGSQAAKADRFEQREKTNTENNTLNSDSTLQISAANSALRELLQPSAADQTRQQRRADQQLVQTRTDELQSLLARLQATLRLQVRDKDTKQRERDVSELLADTKQLAAQLTKVTDTPLSKLQTAFTKP